MTNYFWYNSVTHSGKLCAVLWCNEC